MTNADQERRTPKRLLSNFRPIVEEDNPLFGGRTATFTDLKHPISRVLPELKQLFRPDLPRVSALLDQPGHDSDVLGPKAQKLGRVSWLENKDRDELSVTIELTEESWKKLEARHLGTGARGGGGGS